MDKYTMYGKLTALPGKREELSTLLLEASRCLRHVDGCELYIINESVEDPDVIWITEMWRDTEAHAESLHNTEVLAIIQRARPLIATIEPIRLRPLGGIGL
ncbi:quinol monooxygenase YgiN [Paenibacillus shirakamiensis]|uniref:Quinol monooxygenase YgiN n=1 Tax=Paenibacillus shirakamiensis TaxID=1265935 RepID=A0ABS4JHS0_9BACL|nr:antibiotic biosynthesis monooxygenase [Paenibacillus shirakamiensis]MBP2000084.1 quinol monooxygenase YgiN [Paenibacillus shirakamiensis]